MTNEAKELKTTAEAPAEDETMAQKACKTQVIRAKQNRIRTKRKNEKLQNHCKLHNKRSNRAQYYGGATSLRRRILCKNAMQTRKRKRPTQHPRTHHIRKRL